MQVEIFSISYVYLISAMVGESIRFISVWTEYLWQNSVKAQQQQQRKARCRV